MSIMRKIGLGGALAATALAAASPAMAQDYRGYHRGGDNTAAVAIGAGVVGLALGAIIASNNDHHYRDYPGYAYDAGYSYGPSWSSGWEYRDGWYWDRDGGRHGRDEYARYHRNDRGDFRGDFRRGYDHDRGDFRRGF